MKRDVTDWLFVVAGTLLGLGSACLVVGCYWPTAPMLSWQGAYVLGSGIAGNAFMFMVTRP